jgi:hypothetical protein
VTAAEALLPLPEVVFMAEVLLPLTIGHGEIDYLVVCPARCAR